MDMSCLNVLHLSNWGACSADPTTITKLGMHPISSHLRIRRHCSFQNRQAKLEAKSIGGDGISCSSLDVPFRKYFEGMLWCSFTTSLSWSRGHCTIDPINYRNNTERHSELALAGKEERFKKMMAMLDLLGSETRLSRTSSSMRFDDLVLERRLPNIRIQYQVHPPVSTWIKLDNSFFSKAPPKERCKRSTVMPDMWYLVHRRTACCTE